jgi:L-asparaginase/Glu-tRNA(Gln) amidotransferase subunit D
MTSCKGIILQSFGAGNVPNEHPFSWEGFIKESTFLGKPVLITSQFPANATSNTNYVPGKAAKEAGAIPTGNMTSACATVKFRWVLAQIEKMNFSNDKEGNKQKISKVKEMMNDIYVGEMDASNNA